MLLVFSHFAVSRPLLTNLPSFPLGQTAFSTPWVPVGLGSFLGWVPSHLLQPARAGALPRQPAGREPRRPPALGCGCGRSLGKAWTSFSHDSWNSVSYSISLNWACHLVWQKIGSFIFFFLNPKFHWKTPQLSFFSEASRVLVS